MKDLMLLEIQGIINAISNQHISDEKIKTTKSLLIRLKNTLYKIKPIEARNLLLSARQTFGQSLLYRQHTFREKKVMDTFQILLMRINKWFKES